MHLYTETHCEMCKRRFGADDTVEEMYKIGRAHV